MNSPQPQHDELFSAYLDGEVSDSQRAEVERLLAADPQHRKTLDELRALSSSLQTLPQYRLGDDFADRVLRQAERTMLAPAPSDAEPIVSRPDADAPADRGSFRGLMWAAAAIAAAVLVAVLGPRIADLGSNGDAPEVVEQPAGGTPRSVQKDPSTGLAMNDASSRDDGTTVVQEQPENDGSPEPEAVQPNAIAQDERGNEVVDLPGAIDDPRQPSPLKQPGSIVDQHPDAGPDPDDGAAVFPGNTVGADALPSLLMVVELTPTAEGADPRVFDAALRRHGIELDAEAPLDSRDAAAVAGAVAQFDARRHQLIYVDASGEQVDDLIADLDERRELFAAVHRQLVDGPPLAPRRPQGAHVGAAASDEPLPSTADRPEQDAAPRGVARRLTIGDLPVDATGPAAVARAMQDDSMVSVAETDDDTEQSASFGVLFVVRPPRAEGE